jgi:hypothetical protein
MIVPSRPDASSPRPSGPDLSSPTGGSCRSADLDAADIWLSCHRISSMTASGGSGAARPAALAAYAAAPRACAPMWATAAACPAALAAAAADGVATSRAAAPPTRRRRISSATSSSPRAKARVRTMASRGRLSPGASASNSHSTRSAQSAAHPATIRLSASLSVCGEPTPLILPGTQAGWAVARRPPPGHSRASLCERSRPFAAVNSCAVQVPALESRRRSCRYVRTETKSGGQAARGSSWQGSWGHGWKLMPLRLTI